MYLLITLAISLWRLFGKKLEVRIFAMAKKNKKAFQSNANHPLVDNTSYKVNKNAFQ